jgi:hypothetical protein
MQAIININLMYMFLKLKYFQVFHLRDIDKYFFLWKQLAAFFAENLTGYQARVLYEPHIFSNYSNALASSSMCSSFIMGDHKFQHI